MLRQLVQVTTGYAVFVAVAGVVCQVRHAARQALRPALVALQTLLVAQAGAALWAWHQGPAPAEPATQAGYLATSVLLLPLTLRRAPDPAAAATADDGSAEPASDPWAHLTTAVVAIITAIICVRLYQTAGGRAHA